MEKVLPRCGRRRSSATFLTFRELWKISMSFNKAYVDL